MKLSTWIASSLLSLSLVACNKTAAPLAPEGCLIGGANQGSGDLNPANPCQSCLPASSSSAWSSASDGTSCGLGEICTQGECAAGCLIGGTFFVATAVNPANSCEVCKPAGSTTAWTATTGPAPAGGSCSVGQVCSAGACTAGCLIEGSLVAPGSSAPGQSCLTCQPPASTSSWSPVTGPAPAGGSCGAGEVCDNGNCEAGCLVDGGFYATGAASPTNACATCQPAASTSEFIATSGLPPDGSCAAGEVCSAGSCAAGCWIGGGYVASGAMLPGAACLQCLPASSTSSYTPYTGLAPDGGCAAEEVCKSGACASGCIIDDAYVGAGQTDSQHSCRSCEPATSTQVWVNSFVPWHASLPGAAFSMVADLTNGTPDVVAASGNIDWYLNDTGGAGFDDAGAVYASVAAQTPGAALPYSNPPFPDVFFVGSNPAGAGQAIQYAKNLGDGGLAGCTQGGEAVPCVFSTGTDSIVAIAGGTFGGADAGLGLAALDLADSRIDFFTTLHTTMASIAFTAPPPTASSVQVHGLLASGDFNGDGRDDLVLGIVWYPYQTEILLALAQPDGGFASPVTVAAAQPGAVGFFASADFNGDGKLDLAFTDQDTHLWIADGDGLGGFAPAVATDIAGAPSWLVAADFNGDGLPDVALTSYGPQTIDVLYNQGNGTFASPLVVYTTDQDPTSLSVSAWRPPAGGGSYGSPAQLLSSTDNGGDVIALVNSCQ